MLNTNEYLFKIFFSDFVKQYMKGVSFVQFFLRIIKAEVNYIRYYLHKTLQIGTMSTYCFRIQFYSECKLHFFHNMLIQILKNWFNNIKMPFQKCTTFV